MDNLIITTPDKLTELIAAAVHSEFLKFAQQAPAASTVTTPAKDPLLTRKEAAAILKISLPTLGNMVKDGKLKAHTIPGTNRPRYYFSDVNNCLTSIKPAA